MNKTDKHDDAPVSRKLTVGGAFAAQVRVFLNERLKPYGVDCEQLYITTVHSVIEPKVTFSQSLLALGNDTLEWDLVQSYTHGLTGIFAQHWTFEEEHRFSKLSFYEVEQFMRELLQEARHSWMR